MNIWTAALSCIASEALKLNKATCLRKFKPWPAERGGESGEVSLDKCDAYPDA